MSQPMNRREMLRVSTAAAVAAGSGLGCASSGLPTGQTVCRQESPGGAGKRRMRLGMVTYNLARDWDLDTIIARYKEVGIEAVEFRTTHKHGVEPTLSKEARKEVKKRCADGGLVIWCLGTACEYHSANGATLEKNIEETKRFIELAADLECPGVKVRPNGLPKEVNEASTLEQIGRSLRLVGEVGAQHGVGIWCEMHGDGTSHPPRMRRIMDVADHPNVGVVWNSNPGVDEKDGSIREHFDLLRHKICSVHINELVNGYPYRQLFSLLNEMGYDRYTMIEAQGLKGGQIEDMVRFMKFYKALWEELSRPA